MKILKKLITNLDHLDPTPWHQAALLGLAFFALICLAVFGNYIDKI